MSIENIAEIHEFVGPYDVVVEVETKYGRWGRSSDPKIGIGVVVVGAQYGYFHEHGLVCRYGIWIIGNCGCNSYTPISPLIVAKSSFI